MHTLNLGIVAHVDAGKTSLTERLLFEAGVLDEPGSVDAGSTHTDTMLLERRRGITIRSAVASFLVDDVTVNVVDTPGHADFVAEVERALAVLDGAVLVVSAVEGVQAQTLVLFRVLRRLRIPTVLFVNKIDRLGARPDDVVAEIEQRLGPPLPLQSVGLTGTRAACVVPYDADRLTELVAEQDDLFVPAYVNGTAPPMAALVARIADRARRGLTHPVLFGSAITGAGVRELLALLPHMFGGTADQDGPASGLVFKIERGPAGEKLAFVRLRTGSVSVRDRLDLGHGVPERLTALRVFRPGGAENAVTLRAGQIGILRGLELARVGDVIGAAAAPPGGQFTRPSLAAVVEPVDPADREALHVALTQLVEQDPLIDVTRDAEGGLSVSLYGEVQKEVVGALLADDYGIDVRFAESSTLCIERLVAVGAAAELIGVAPNPFLATVGLRVEPAPVGAGVDVRLEVELGSMPKAFFVAVEEAVRATLRQGPHGWEVPDCRVVVTHSGYYARQSHAHGTFDKSMSSTAGDFRGLAPLVLMAALRRAGTTVCEPVHRFELELPQAAYAGVLAMLPHVGAVPLETVPRRGLLVLRGDVPAATVHRFQQRVPDLTRGEGMLVTELDHHRPASRPPPTRPRSDDDPTDRENYLKVVARRVGRT